MAFSALTTNYGALSIGVFVRVVATNVSSGATQTLYFSDGEHPATDWVGIGAVNWLGKIRGDWTITKPDQKIGQSGWTHPTASFDIWLGGAEDDLWDYLGVNWEWDNGTADVWLVDLSQTPGSGYRKQIQGNVRKGPEDLELFKSFRLDIVGNHYKERILATQLAAPTPSGTGFVRPGAQVTTNHNKTSAAVAAADTTILLSFISGASNPYRRGRVVILSTSTEMIWIGGVSLPGPSLTRLRRGYGGTSALSYAAGTSAHVYKNGTHGAYAPDTAREQTLPYVFGKGAIDRGIVLEVWPASVEGDWAIIAAVSTIGPLDAWAGRGKIGNHGKAWWKNGGVITEAAAVDVDAYNDLDNPNPNAFYPHMGIAGQPTHPLPAGTYYNFASNGDFDDDEYKSDSDKMWVRLQGVSAGVGSPIRWPTGTTNYLLTNANWSFGYTLSNVVYSVSGDTRISGPSTGKWADEYTEDYWSEITGIVPEKGSTGDIPFIMDVLHEQADLVNSDFFVREGLLYPTRRGAAAVADYTIDNTDFSAGGKAQMLKDPQTIYCNVLTAECSQAVLSQPSFTRDEDPVNVPYTSLLQDNAEIGRRGRREATAARKWWRFHMSDSWTPYANDDDGSAHLEYWEAAHQDMLDQRAQPQIWMEAKLSPRFLTIEQGETIAFDCAPFTTRKGQVRAVKIQGGQGKPITVTVRSWHISF